MVGHVWELGDPRCGVADPLGMDGHPTGGRVLAACLSLQGPSLGLSSVELCHPMLVCPLEGPEGLRGRECFLWVTAGHLFEVELQAARTLERLELQSLEAAEIEAETQTQSEPVPEVSDGSRASGSGAGLLWEPALTAWRQVPGTGRRASHTLCELRASEGR